LRRRNVTVTGSETTLQWKGFDGIRLTRAPLGEIGAATAVA
jgi:hypothetical protein